MPHAAVPSINRSNARRMRKTMTEAEARLWNALRAHRLMGLGFRRQFPVAGYQFPVAGYIADFACPTHKLIVEVDGSQHGNDEALAYDAKRSLQMQRSGWTVLRFWNDDILKDLDNVCLHIVRITGEKP